ncbi:AraC family transcriptional regulator [Streptomyces sp. FIT100]|uniref:AraC family transcriptional regulator n=1 Tax=Streptomyces sp. FIT100 TaxID=2837956 RepID=UPI0021C7F2C1|nr:AraC family transcriptional regulator [Streptomyces sp. FIT100]UUN29549.1 AraC family transcriptional regulator [Streptomyces sp. FIT100]
MAKDEWARLWQHERLPGIDLLRARYVRHTFPRHSHEGYVFGTITGGIEEVGLPGGVVHAGPGTVVMINPEVPHTARAGVPEGWVYSILYPSSQVVAEIAAETTPIRGTPGFAETDVADRQAAHLIREFHRAAEQGNALAADSVLRIVVARMLRRYGSALPTRETRTAGALNAERARALLEERMDDPPTLHALASELGTSPFALLRAFRDSYGMPPHTWLTDARVRRARQLLDGGAAPAEAAVSVGFTDQPHLTRHFARIVGVPPGAYQRGRGLGAAR